MTPDDLADIEACVWATLRESREDRAALCQLLADADRRETGLRAALRAAIGRNLCLERLALEALGGDDDVNARRERLTEFVKGLLALQDDIMSASECGQTVH